MRMSHTANSYKNGIIIFGGEKEYNTNMRARQCLSDVQVYNCGMQIYSYLLFIFYHNQQIQLKINEKKKNLGNLQLCFAKEICQKLGKIISLLLLAIKF